MVWLTLISLAKCSFYVGIISFIGITAMRRLIRNRYSVQALSTVHKGLMRWLWATLLLSIIGALAIVPLNAGMLLDEGFIGIIDPIMLQITWESSIGEQTLARCIALVLVAICIVWQGQTPLQANYSPALTGLILLTIGTLGWSFTQSGHTATATGLEQLLLAIHIVMAGWWVGSFYPLIALCNLQEPAPLKQTLHHYGKQAAIWVGTLLLSGGLLLLLLIMGVSAEVNTTYLWVMGIKLVLVTMMLCFAAYHKWYLVASLATAQDCKKVKQSIIAEAAIGFLVLGVTATLTSSFGISH